MIRAASAVLMVALSAGLAAAQQPACPAPTAAAATPGGALPATAAALRTGGPLRVLVIGSSTTAGVGAGGQGYAYRLGPLLKARWPNVAIEIAISGVLAETASGAATRLAGEMAARRPHLVIWQLGTNDATFGVAPERFRSTVASGLAAIRAAGADAVLVDPQYSRWAERGGEATAVKARIVAEEGARGGVPVVRRFSAMQRLAAADRPTFDRLIAWDGLHLSPAGHACMAQQVAGTIVGTAR